MTSKGNELPEPTAGKPLEPRKCPACGKDCVERSGKNGKFMGCPDFPTCPGKLVLRGNPLSEAQETAAYAQLKLTHSFIRAVGGVRQAEAWIKVAAGMIEAAKPE